VLGITSSSVSESAGSRYLVTGAYGCIGAWTVRQLVGAGRAVVTFDAGADSRRLRWLMSDEELAGVAQVRADITDLARLETVLDEHAITNVIHLAALQVPFCREDPPLGARVNVVGTVNLFEAARRRAGRIRNVVYASSIAAYDAIDGDLDAPAAMTGLPSTLYGVYKRANEGTAHIYWADHQLASIGLRPHTVFGVGRDQGLTSAPTFALLAAATGEAYHIPYGGRHQLQYAQDVARDFIAASDASFGGASVHNLGGDVTDIAEVIAAIGRAVPGSLGMITSDPHTLLPFPPEADASGLEAIIGPRADTPLDLAVAQTIDRFRRLQERGLLAPAA
jgi:UDP-glucuronate 4-epimerase